MTSNNYSIIFSSVTGNTKKLADTIHETLPQDMCDYFGGNELQVPESDLLYIGFGCKFEHIQFNTSVFTLKEQNHANFVPELCQLFARLSGR